MTKVKIFTGSSASVEKSINEWLKENEGVIELVSQHFSSYQSCSYSIAIFYKDKA